MVFFCFTVTLKKIAAIAILYLCQNHVSTYKGPPSQPPPKIVNHCDKEGLYLNGNICIGRVDIPNLPGWIVVQVLFHVHACQHDKCCWQACAPQAMMPTHLPQNALIVNPRERMAKLEGFSSLTMMINQM